MSCMCVQVVLSDNLLWDTIALLLAIVSAVADALHSIEDCDGVRCSSSDHTCTPC